MRALVTGAAGYVGSRLLARLLREGVEVVSFGRALQPVISGAKGLRAITAEMRSFDDWLDLLDGVTVVYHLGWSSLPTTASADPSADAASNIMGTLRLLEALRERPGVRFVFASSGGTVYGQVESLPIDENHATRPISAYGVSKLAIESYLRFYHLSYGLRPVTLRFANIYGPGQVVGRQFGAISTFASNMIRGEQITIFGDGSIVRDYVFVDDVVEALMAAARCLQDFDCCNIGSGEGRSLNAIIAEIQSILRTEPVLRYLPARAYDVPTSVLDIRRAQDELCWRPDVRFIDGLNRTVLALQKDILAG